MIKLVDCQPGMPLEVVQTQELLIVEDVQDGTLICRNLTTLLHQEHDVDLVNLSGNVRMASAEMIKLQAEKKLNDIRESIANYKALIGELETESETTFELLKLVRSYEVAKI